jgi:hypothetical protein
MVTCNCNLSCSKPNEAKFWFDEEGGSSKLQGDGGAGAVASSFCIFSPRNCILLAAANAEM